MAINKERVNGLILRVDDRLLHGQVIFGWGLSGNVKKIWLINEHVAGDSREKELYDSALPPDLHGGVLSMQEAMEKWESSELSSESVMAVVENCQDLETLISKGIKPVEIHLGAVSHSGDRKPFADSVALNSEDLDSLKRVEMAGFVPVLKDLPGNSATVLKI